MKTSPRGIALIKEFEGFRQQAYIPVPGDVPTIGYGFTKGVRMGDTMTVAQATKRLVVELEEYERGVMLAAGRCNQNQFDALVCFAFNVGVGGMTRSTVIKAHRAGNFQAAARAFSLWNKSGGRVYAGLTRRRHAEAALYLEPVAVVDPLPFAALPEPEPMPQTVEPERPMTASTINRASVVAGGTATVAAVSETIQTINGVKYGVESLGNWLVPVLLVAVVALCGYIVWERVRTRTEGWA